MDQGAMIYKFAFQTATRGYYEGHNFNFFSEVEVLTLDLSR